MTVVFGILGILCLIYYGVIVIYSGAGTSFSAIWIILALGFFAAAAVMKFYPRFRDKVPVQLEVAVITFFSAIAFIFVMVELMMGFSSITFQKESVNYVIVLGAQVRGNKISRTLERRLDKAVEYAAYHPNTVFVLSGGQGEDEDVTEASAMYRYMKSRGVPDYQLLLEESSRSTYENMVYSKILITERERLRRATLRAAMVTFFRRMRKSRSAWASSPAISTNSGQKESQDTSESRMSAEFPRSRIRCFLHIFVSESVLRY